MIPTNDSKYQFDMRKRERTIRNKNMSKGDKTMPKNAPNLTDKNKVLQGSTPDSS